MRPLFHKKQVLDLIGTNTQVDAFSFPDGCYRQFEAACGDGIIKLTYTKTTRIYKDFDNLYSENVQVIRDIKYPGETSTFRQCAIRKYYNREGIILGDDDIWEETNQNVYIKCIRTDAQFAPLSVSDNTIELIAPIANPYGGTTTTGEYEPFVDGALVIESTWKGKHCEFYIPKIDVETWGWYAPYLLSDANTTVKLHGNVKSFSSTMLQHIDDEPPAYVPLSSLSIRNNNALQWIDLYRIPNGFSLVLENTPGVNGINLHEAITPEIEQQLAAVIIASTIYGTVYNTLDEYYEQLKNAIDDNPYWQMKYYNP